MAGVAERARSAVESAVEAAGCRVWDVRYVKEGGEWYLRVYIDRPGGVDLDTCAEVSRAIDPLLDEADPVPGPYFLEVCSPGVGRELTRPEHFAEYLGRAVRLRLYRPAEGSREVRGVLRAAGPGGVTIEAAGEEKTFPREAVERITADEETEEC